MIFYKKKKQVLLIAISFLLLGFLVTFKCLITEDKSKELTVAFSVEPGFYDEPFELELLSETGTVYYTLDGTVPDKNSIKYEGPIWIEDVTENDNVHSMRTDVSTGFDREEIEKLSSEYPEYQVPDYKVDKATIIRAVARDEMGNYSDVKTASYFVGYEDKSGYEGMKIVSLVTDPSNLFGYETGIYVTGKAYDEYVDKYRGKGEFYWREEFWGFWQANYRYRGKEWERKAECQFFDETGKLELSQQCGIRIHGGGSRSYNQKSLNIYARKQYDGNKILGFDFFGTGYAPSAVTLSQGGNDLRSKTKDYVVMTAIKDLEIATMNYEPYVLFLDGEYWGIYWLNEKYNADYLAYYYGVKKDNVIMIKDGTLEEGEDDDINYYLKMYEFCSSADVTNSVNYAKVCDMIDIESYIDYYAVMLYISRCGDWPGANYALWRVKKPESGSYGDGKWRWMIFDLNSPAFYSDFDTIKYVAETDEMFKNLMTNDTFRLKLIQRIEELGETVFEYEKIDAILSECQSMIEEPMRENEKRFYGDDSLSVFDEEVRRVRTFFRERKEKLDLILDEYR